MKTAEEYLKDKGFFAMTHKEGSESVRKAFIEPVIKAMQDYASQQCQKRDELIKAQDELIEFYGKIISDSSMFLHVHHWEESTENIEKGQELRFKIEQLKKQIQ